MRTPDRRLGLVAAVAFAAVTAAAGSVQGPETRYPGVGPGHYVHETREAGRFVVLEDKSVWEIAEPSRFVTAEWQAMEGISVRFAEGEPPFAYELSNTDRDEGAAARWIRR